MWDKISKLNQTLTICSVSGLIGFWIYKNTHDKQIKTLNSGEKRIPRLTKDRNTGFIDERYQGVQRFGDASRPELDEKYILTIFSNEKFYESVLKYIHKKYPHKIKDFSYEEESIGTFNEFRQRRKEPPKTMKVLTPRECNFDITYEYEKIDYKINIDVSVQLDHRNNPMTLTRANECCGADEDIISKMTLISDNKESIISFVDEANEDTREEYDKRKRCSSETLRIFYYKKDYWALLSKAPKRSVNTIYLKEGQREKIVKQVGTFFSPETRNIYLSFGIPYKSVSMIYGPPGTGKTSMIRGLASELDCDLYVLPITKEMKDTDFVGAFSYISDNEGKEKIIVIEDIDTLFEERKEGDKYNGITLQSLLNCLDGFTCIEGTMLFLTANKPEVLDYAIMRSCRIDNKIELGYADKYQIKQMFTKFLPTQVENFAAFYDLIRHKEFTTACLQEFLFYNRDCENILDIMDIFTEILEKNDPKNFEIVKDENKNFYS